MRMYIWLCSSIRGPMDCWETLYFAYLTSFYFFDVLRAIYGSFSQHFLFLNEFWVIWTFRGLFSSNKKWKTIKSIHIFTLNYTLKTKKYQKIKKRWKNFLKVALHLVHSNSFSPNKSLHVCKLEHRWRTTLIE